MDGIVIDSEPKVEQGAKQIIESAIAGGVTDIHIEPRDKLLVVRYRRGNNLHVAGKLPKSKAEATAKYLKQLANLETNKTNAPQSGQYELKLGHYTYSLEISTLPVLDGEKLTVHIVELTAKLPELTDLGFWGTGANDLRRSLSQSSGLILIGSRGRGSVLTLMAMIESLPATSKIAFISEADEPLLPATIKKVLAKPTGRISTESNLDRLSRQDHDIIAVDILRSSADVVSALEASRRSLILAGMPTFGAIKSLVYLTKVAGSETHIPARNAVGQTTVRQLCPNCRESYEPSAMDQVKLQKFFHVHNSKAIKLG